MIENKTAMNDTDKSDIFTPFVVTSKTRQRNIKHPELCWMDVPEWKLEQAAAMQAEVRLEYHHHVDGEYVCSCVYALDARTLHERLEIYRSKIYKTYTKKPFYRVYLEHATGNLYTTYCNTRLLICTLAPAYSETRVRLGTYALKQAVDQLKSLEGNPLMQLVARTAIWAPMEAVMAQKPEELIYLRLKAGKDEKKGDECGIYKLDDNTQANRIIKAAVKKYLHFAIAPKEWHVCHIWEGSCYDPRYHTNLRNLVLLPSSIYSLTDYDKNVSAMLKHRAAELFGGWTPENRSLPPKPPHYRRVSWLNLPKDIF